MQPVSKIETEYLWVGNGDLTIGCYLATSEKPKGDVIVLHEVFGVNGHLRSVIHASVYGLKQFTSRTL